MPGLLRVHGVFDGECFLAEPADDEIRNYGLILDYQDSDSHRPHQLVFLLEALFLFFLDSSLGSN